MFRRTARVIAVIAIALAVANPVGLSHAPRALAAGELVGQEKGFDACTLPSTTSMSKWYQYSPYFIYYAYIGGSDINPNCTSSPSASWISTVISTPGTNYWDLTFTWVGPQMSPTACGGATGNPTLISTNTTTAYNQGSNEGVSAYNKLSSLNVNLTNAPVQYDLEGYGGGTTCRAAAKSFMKGWADELQLAPAQKSGAYGSSCGSYLDDFASDGNPPDYIWGAQWNGAANVTPLDCVSNTHWTQQQRHHQYAKTHFETWDAVTISIDNDCADGPVYGNANNADGTCGS